MERFKTKNIEKLALKKVVKETELKPKFKEPLKMKIVIYSEDDKYFVNHFTAYALGLKSTRTVMLDQPKLFAISLDTLKELQSNNNLEIEYKLLKNHPLNYNNLFANLKSDFYGIGLHGIFSGDKLNIAENILDSGLKINNNAKSILSTTISLGLNNKDFDESQIFKYQYGTGKKVNIVIAVPTYIENEQHERIFLGFPKQNLTVSANQYYDTCLLDRICSKLKYLPKEFILGYVNEQSIVTNPNFYDNLSKEAQENLFDLLKQNMDSLSLSINKMIVEKNIEALEKMQKELENLNVDSKLISNALEIAQKNLPKKRTVILTNEDKINSSSLPITHRKALLNNMLVQLIELNEQQNIPKK